MTSEQPPLDELCRAEITSLFSFFQDWMLGELENSDEVFDRCESALAPTFELISTGGESIGLQPLLLSLRGAHGSRQDFEIRVENFVCHTFGEDTALITYEEWHRLGEEHKGRVATALLTRSAPAPGGVQWLHVHETWLPEDGDDGERADGDGDGDGD